MNNLAIIYSFNRLISVFISISLNCNFSINFFGEYRLKIFVSDVTDGTSKDVEHYHWNGLTHAKLRMKWRATFRMDEMKGKIKDEMKGKIMVKRWSWRQQRKYNWSRFAQRMNEKSSSFFNTFFLNQIVLAQFVL